MSIEDKFINHEVRIRELEHVCDQINKRLGWIIVISGGILTSIVIPITLHYLKLS